MQIRHMRMTNTEWAKCRALGGAEWMRGKIRLARLTDEQLHLMEEILEELKKNPDLD